MDPRLEEFTAGAEASAYGADTGGAGRSLPALLSRRAAEGLAVLVAVAALTSVWSREGRRDERLSQARNAFLACEESALAGREIALGDARTAYAAVVDMRTGTAHAEAMSAAEAERWRRIAEDVRKGLEPAYDGFEGPVSHLVLYGPMTRAEALEAARVMDETGPGAYPERATADLCPGGGP